MIDRLEETGRPDDEILPILRYIYNADRARQELERMQAERIEQWRIECNQYPDLFENIFILALEKHEQSDRFEIPTSSRKTEIELVIPHYGGTFWDPEWSLRMWIKKAEIGKMFREGNFTVTYLEKERTLRTRPPRDNPYPYLITGRTIHTDFEKMRDYAQGRGEILLSNVVNDDLAIWDAKKALEELQQEMPLWQPV
ncbi:MAG TPA: hypothetical protein VK338_05730 [Candidatus Nitrosocosmicus sp.]|nr:hypothetical protein [Candidatus Nitrosocosmicus sp.]